MKQLVRAIRRLRRAGPTGPGAKRPAPGPASAPTPAPPQSRPAQPSLQRLGCASVISDKGNDNQLHGQPPSGSGCKISFEGSGNRIELGSKVILNDLTIVVRGDRCRLSIGDGARVSGRVNLNNEGSHIQIGAQSTVERFGLVAGEGCSIIIGADCMFSYGIEIRTTDSHSILDAASRKRINKPAPVTIGDHVWVGANVLIGKGVTVPANVIIGQGSVLAKSVEEANCIVVGNPGRIVRTGTTWDRHLLPFED